MNKRIRNKVEKRTGRPAQPHTTGAKPAKQARAHARQGSAASEPHAGAPKHDRKKRGLAARLVRGARKRAESAVGEVQERVEGAVGRVKGRIARTEKRAESLLEKVPVVGSVAAKKLHDLTQR